MEPLNDQHFALSAYSQEGEDIILWRLLQNQERGFFVDVGAHHPFRFSNTYFFYKKGWRGINIEADPAAIALFAAYRPEDINLSCMVSDEEKTYDFDIYNEPALNSGIAARREHVGSHYFVKETLKLPARRLDTLLDEHLPPGTTIDFLSVDIEGFDYNALISNNWTKYRPRFLVVESYIDLNTTHRNPVHDLLVAQGYALRSFLFLSAVYVRQDAA